MIEALRTTVVVSAFIASQAVAACTVPDRDFTSFFERFSDDAEFQEQRLAEKIRLGRFRGEESSERFVWNEVSSGDVRRAYGSSIVPSARERKESYDLHFGPSHAKHRVVEIHKQESDSYEVTLFFASTESCWYLYGIEDKSNVTWPK